MKTAIKTSAPIPTDSFTGMPQAQLARAMWALGVKHIQGFWRSFARSDHYASIQRDCDVVSRLEEGKLAWVLMTGKSYLVEIGPVLWEKDRAGNSLKVETEPPVCIGEDRTLGLRFLELAAEPNVKTDFYLIDTFAPASQRIRPASSVELIGMAAIHEAWRSRDAEEMQEHSREVWCRMKGR